MTNPLPEKTKGRKAIKYRGAQCLNCGHPLDLSDVYCSYCGQLNTTKNLSLKDFFGEFMSSIFTYDSRLRYTLKDLLFRPGVMTRNYVKGQRLKYANPFRFFLSVSIVFFIIQGIIASITGENPLITDNSKANEPNIEMGPTGNNIRIFTTQNDTITNVNGVPLDTFFVQNKIPARKELDSIIQSSIKKDTVQTYDYISEVDLDTLSRLNRIGRRLSLYYNFYKTTKIKDPRQALDSLRHPQTKYNRWAYQKNEAFEQIKENPAEFGTYLLEKTPFFVFFFTPFYALFFWLVYSKKKYTYMEHMIFIFHIFSFVFLAMIIALVPDTLIGSEILGGILFAFIGPFYFYKALRNFYRQNRLITIIKFLFLNLVFMISATISAIIFFAITAALY